MSVVFEITGSGSIRVELPNPSLGDADQPNIMTKFKMSMASTIYSYLFTPPITKFLLNFVGITAQNVANMIQLIKTAVTKNYVVYTDYDSNNYHVRIVNNPFEVSANGRMICDAYPLQKGEHHSFTLELEVLP